MVVRWLAAPLVLFALVGSTHAQDDPDRSSPRAAFRAHGELHEAIRQGIQTRLKITKVQNRKYAFYTPEFTALLRKRTARHRKENPPVLFVERWIADREEQRAGGVMIYGRISRTRPGKKELIESQDIRMLFLKVEDDWFIASWETKCQFCDGKGAGCGLCFKRGWSRVRITSGIRYLTGVFARRLEDEPARDLSTPEALITSLRGTELALKRELRLELVKLRDAYQRLIRTYHLKKDADDLDRRVARDVLQQRADQAKIRWKISGSRREPTSVVVLTKEVTVHVTRRRAFRVRRVGSEWRIDDFGRGCGRCLAAGACLECKEEERAEPCFYCKPKPGKCRACDGAGYFWVRSGGR